MRTAGRAAAIIRVVLIRARPHFSVTRLHIDLTGSFRGVRFRFGAERRYSWYSSFRGFGMQHLPAVVTRHAKNVCVNLM
jgi:hypothetical protein